MVAIAEQLAERLLRLYERSSEVDLREFLRATDARTHDDDAIAELVDADGRERLRRGLAVDLDRYLVAVPGLATRRVPLDAAIEFSMRWLTASGLDAAAAASRLTARYPELAPAIR